MMADPTSRTMRIGDAERAAAQRALQSHLGAGHLQITEFVHRFASAADAVTAEELAVLFADLPEPHPALPGSSRSRARIHAAVVGIAALLALGSVLGLAVGTGRPTPAPTSGAVTAPTPDPSPTTSPTGLATPGRDTVENPTVRRTTGPGLITLGPSYGVDLDDVISPAWDVGTDCCEQDVGFDPAATRLSIGNGHAVTTGPPEFATCLRETAYTTSAIERASLHPGDTMCVRTNGHRLALVTIVDASEQAVEFGATVWDPPVP